MEKTISISLSKIAAVLVASFQWNSQEEHLHHCDAYKAIMSEDDYNEVARIAHDIIERNNIKCHVK